MDSNVLLLLLVLMPIAALLYASVGHGGASAYLAVMATVGIPHSESRTIALILNCFVASSAFIQFGRMQPIPWKMLGILLAASVPFAYIGGTIDVQDGVYRPMLGVVLVFAALRMFWRQPSNTEVVRTPPWWMLMALSAVIGLLSGILGIGGGVLLSPALILLSWSTAKQTAIISSLYIVVNSMAGLAGAWNAALVTDVSVLSVVGVTIPAGIVGAYIGARWYSPTILRRVLACVLLVASIKLFIS